MEPSSKTTSKYIVTCACPGTPKFAQDAFAILHPDEPQPPIVSGRTDIISLAEKFNKTEFYDKLMALSRSKEKFAYLFTIEYGEVKELVNLKSGARVQ